MRISLKTEHRWFICILALLFILSSGLAIYFEKTYFLLVPFGALLIYPAFYNYRILYYLFLLTLLFSIPFSIGSSNIDLPSEPLMIILLLLSFIILVNNTIDLSFLRHPVTLLLLAHFAWMILVSFYSVNTLHSIKYLLAKTWYIAAFYFFTCVILQKIEDFRKIYWLLYIPFLAIIFYTLIRHYQLGLTFEDANIPMNPFFANHVLYSTAVVVFLPFVYFAYYNKNYNTNSFRSFVLGFSIFLFIVAIGFSYTRASWLGIPIGLGVYIILKNNLMKAALVFTGVCLIAMVIYLTSNNRFMEFAPDFKSTIFHKGDIEGHLAATYKMEDVSGMERVNRWVAAKRMVEDRPMLGSGPSTFYPEYKKYMLNSFYTYVSDNPEMSTTHNYFLMVLCEQGIIGFLLFSTISVMLIIMGARIYKTSPDKQHRNLAMACTASLVIFYFHLMLNDLVETDKIGGLFFISMAVLVRLDQWTKNQPVLNQNHL
jgi:O-antigen ligase